MSLINISLMANIFLVLVTTYYAILTHRLLVASKRQMQLTESQIEYQQRPYVEISAGLREGSSLFQLRIVNTGATTARDVTFNMSPDFYRFHEKSTKNHMQGLHVFSHTLASLPPKAELVFDLGASHMFFRGEQADAVAPPTFTVKAAYRWGARKFDEETFIDLRMFGGASAAPAGQLKELKDLNTNLDKLVDAVKELKNV